MSSAVATKLLQNQLKKIHSEPVEGFTVDLKSESNIFEWRVFVEGPKETPYEGGVFQMLMQFPADYPMMPPTLRFVSEFWHPNVHSDGRVCISILHPPGHDEMSGELPEERWLPTQTVTTVVLSVMSMLSDPNFSSPANVDASVEWRKNFEAYKKRCKRLCDKSLRELPPHVRIPHPDTDPEERRRHLQKLKALEEDTFDLHEADADFDNYDFGDGDGALGDDDDDDAIDDDDGEDDEAATSSSSKLKSPSKPKATVFATKPSTASTTVMASNNAASTTVVSLPAPTPTPTLAQRTSSKPPAAAVGAQAAAAVPVPVPTPSSVSPPVAAAAAPTPAPVAGTAMVAAASSADRRARRDKKERKDKEPKKEKKEKKDKKAAVLGDKLEKKDKKESKKD